MTPFHNNKFGSSIHEQLEQAAEIIIVICHLNFMQPALLPNHRVRAEVTRTKERRKEGVLTLWPSSLARWMIRCSSSRPTNFGFHCCIHQDSTGPASDADWWKNLLLIHHARNACNWSRFVTNFRFLGRFYFDFSFLFAPLNWFGGALSIWWYFF